MFSYVFSEIYLYFQCFNFNYYYYFFVAGMIKAILVPLI
ncbi:hypothetical protein GLIP_3439 [Aliiglaciecola lipolytica E3]|uniref:Uncharacterized protein n=1 Tax=Aliiglaciecola lipolytica E3 TaxID=1127673 RepID=K6YHF5_9ALTE|nr:hypothetical protein GLIP_3439 [Aliiglaciecola lipolytica E3]